MKRKTDWILAGGLVSLIAFYYCGLSMVMSLLGAREAKDLFWYGLGAVISGVAFKLSIDQV